MIDSWCFLITSFVGQLEMMCVCCFFFFADSVANVKSPLKDVKTSKNIQMKSKYCQEPLDSLLRTEALSPLWMECECLYSR